MLPDRAKLDQLLKGINKSRVRRAFETAKIGKPPQGIITDLRLKGVDQVHHVTLDLESLGADAYLAEAGWIKRAGPGLDLPQPVTERFTVDIISAGGEIERLPLVGPMASSHADGQLWTYASPQYSVEIIDGCSLSGSFWTVAAGLNEEPVELVVTDASAGVSASHLLWTDRRDVSRVVDTSTLTTCP
jgi:hypothetical protein